MNFRSLFGPLDIVEYKHKNTWESNLSQTLVDKNSWENLSQTLVDKNYQLPTTFCCKSSLHIYETWSFYICSLKFSFDKFYISHWQWRKCKIMYDSRTKFNPLFSGHFWAGGNDQEPVQGGEWSNIEAVPGSPGPWKDKIHIRQCKMSSTKKNLPVKEICGDCLYVWGPEPHTPPPYTVH